MKSATNIQVDAERFWSKVDKTDGCWNWVAGKSRGYGMIRGIVNGKSRMVLAHRVSYLLEHGKLPDGLHIDHA